MSMRFFTTAALAALALCLVGCAQVWTRDIDGCRVEIREQGDLLEITVRVPSEHGDKFPGSDSGDWVVERALAEYLGITGDGTFECPGLSAVAERSDAAGRVFVFNIPKASLRVVKK